MNDSLSRALADTVARRKATEEQLELLEARVSKLRAVHRMLYNEEKVLSAVQNRQASSPTLDVEIELPEIEVPSADEDWAEVSRSKAVEWAVTALAQTKSYATPGTIHEFLIARNRETDTRDYIGAALAYLNKQGRVTNVGRGQWVPSAKQEDESS